MATVMESGGAHQRRRFAMRWPVEPPRKRTWKDWAFFAAMVLLPGVGQAAYVQLKPLDRNVAGAEAFWCRLDYERARTKSDTLRIDDGSYVVTRDSWERNPTCGEVRKANLLHSSHAAPDTRLTAPPPRPPIVVGPRPQ